MNVAAGVTVSFNNTEFVTAAGTSYNGTVKAFAAYLDPTADNFAGIMPGDLVGINTSNSPVTLESYGMLVVELEGTGGEKLQIAPGHKVKLSMNILNLYWHLPHKIYHYGILMKQMENGRKKALQVKTVTFTRERLRILVFGTAMCPAIS